MFLFFFFLHFSAQGTASTQAVNELSTGNRLDEFQAPSVTAENFIPSAEHGHLYAAQVNTAVSGSPLVGIADASSGSMILPNAIILLVDPAGQVANPIAALDANPSAFVTVNTLAIGSPPVITEYTSSGVISPDAIANASSDAFIGNASSTIVPADAIVDVSSAVIPPDAIAELSPFSPPNALANVPSAVIHPGGSAPVERSQYTIDQIVGESAEYCRRKGLDNNPVEILQWYQTQIIESRMLEVDDPTHDCSVGETNQIFVDRDNVLDTGMGEIKILTNPRLTLEVQFYGEVGFNNQTQGIIKLLLHNTFIRIFMG